MKKSFKLLFLVVFTIICTLIFTSCGNSDGSDENSVPNNDGKTIVLNVFNWGEYISDGFEGSLDTVADFEDYYYEKFGKKNKGQLLNIRHKRGYVFQVKKRRRLL